MWLLVVSFLAACFASDAFCFPVSRACACRCWSDLLPFQLVGEAGACWPDCACMCDVVFALYVSWKQVPLSDGRARFFKPAQFQCECSAHSTRTSPRTSAFASHLLCSSAHTHLQHSMCIHDLCKSTCSDSPLFFCSIYRVRAKRLFGAEIIGE